MIKLKNLLIESPDKIFIGNEMLGYRSEDAVTFGYTPKNEMWLSTAYIYEATINKESRHSLYNVHDELHSKYGMRQQLFQYNYKFPGRLWYEHKIISFWNILPTRKELETILKDIYTEIDKIANKTSKNKMTSPMHCMKILNHLSTDFDIDSESWRIDVPENADGVFSDKKLEYKLIKLCDYNTFTNSIFDRVDHIKSPMIKNREVPDGIGSKTEKYGNLTSTQYNQIVRTSESKE